ncbi:MAG: hypothetical protein ABFE07_15745 [Armatimonadia bacterium]
MRAGQVVLVIAFVIAAAVAVTLSFAVNLSAGLSFAAGVVVGAVSLGSVAFGAYGVTSGLSGPLRLLASLWRWGHLLVVAVLLGLLITRWHANPVWLATGYTVALIVFTIFMTQLRPAPRRNVS